MRNIFDEETYKDYQILKDSLVMGADTNILVAKMVFGFYQMNGRWMINSVDGDYVYLQNRLPEYSTEISDAIKVESICQVFAVEKLRQSWYCELRLKNGGSIHNSHGTLEMAICRAAMKASCEIYEVILPEIEKLK